MSEAAKNPGLRQIDDGSERLRIYPLTDEKTEDRIEEQLRKEDRIRKACRELDARMSLEYAKWTLRTK